MIINHNLNAMYALHCMNRAYEAISKNMLRLSSGLRINSAADDPAGLVISEKMRAQIRGLSQAGRNIQDGISMINTADGALNEVHSLLQRGRELSVQAANGTLSPQDKQNIQLEINEINKELDSISGNTDFNTNKLLNAPAGGKKVILQAGANEGQAISVDLCNVGSINLGVDSADVTVDAQGAITKYDKAIDTVSKYRSYFGAMQNRLGYALDVVNNSEENLTAAESRIRDLDIAKEMMDYAKNSIIFQAAQAMLAQANLQAKSVLKLLEF
ncbi:flagellin [Clostridium sp. JS66]|uniref:flagellin N-terminal helical domain-containing protein n=1 Tax=Clostridium sp. JS66 TaxID=3064705 RepID=UPI00298E8C5D|nr:flagellin [Clostridium sp. JS66]WPC41048.1 flagellin [Clostridium sp. JS66]